MTAPRTCGWCRCAITGRRHKKFCDSSCRSRNSRGTAKPTSCSDCGEALINGRPVECRYTCASCLAQPRSTDRYLTESIPGVREAGIGGSWALSSTLICRCGGWATTDWAGDLVCHRCGLYQMRRLSAITESAQRFAAADRMFDDNAEDEPRPPSSPWTEVHPGALRGRTVRQRGEPLPELPQRPKSCQRCGEALPKGQRTKWVLDEGSGRRFPTLRCEVHSADPVFMTYIPPAEPIPDAPPPSWDDYSDRVRRHEEFMRRFEAGVAA